jgi:hypothetical protein
MGAWDYNAENMAYVGDIICHGGNHAVNHLTFSW